MHATEVLSEDTMGRSVSEVAARAVQRSERVTGSDRTNEQIFRDIRFNLNAHLAVTSDDVRFLLAQYDALVIERDQLRAEVDGQKTLIRFAPLTQEVAQVIAESAQVQPSLVDRVLAGIGGDAAPPEPDASR